MTKIKTFQLDIDDDLIIQNPPASNLAASNKSYTDTKLPIAGGTMTGNLIVNANTTTNDLNILGTLDLGTF